MIRYGPLDGWTDMIALKGGLVLLGLAFGSNFFLGHMMMIMKLVEEVISMYRHLTRVL